MSVGFPFITVSSLFKQYTQKCLQKHYGDTFKVANFKKSSFVKKCSEHSVSCLEGTGTQTYIKQKHLRASQLLHISFDKTVDKPASSGDLFSLLDQ